MAGTVSLPGHFGLLLASFLQHRSLPFGCGKAVTSPSLMPRPWARSFMFACSDQTAAGMARQLHSFSCKCADWLGGRAHPFVQREQGYGRNGLLHLLLW